MTYKSKPKGKTYPILPCVDCGGVVALPIKPYYAPKVRCDACDNRHHNRKKTLYKQKRKPIICCEWCLTPFPQGTHLKRKFCDDCMTTKEKSARDRRKEARLERLKGHHCVDCAEPLHLDIEFLKNPDSRGKPSTRCPTCLKKRRNKGKSRKLYETDMGSAFRQIKRRCKTKNLPFDITLEDLVAPNECPVLKKPIIPASIGGVNPMMPSVDRHIPEKGYTKDNIVIMSHRANSLKSNATFEEIEALYLYLRSKREDFSDI